MYKHNKQNKTQLRLHQSGDNSYFLDCIDEFYTTIENNAPKYIVSRETTKAERIKSRLMRKFIAIPFLHRIRIQLANYNVINFAAMISGDFRIVTPAVFFSKQNYIYMYDVWPRFQKWIFPLLDFFNIKYVFFSSKQVYEDYNRKCALNNCKAMWLPEALNVSAYKFKSYSQKKIDVLEFGRNYTKYHDLIVCTLSFNNKIHIFKDSVVPVLFPTKSDFVDALSNSKIVICVPSNISHPERAEYISTMTLRYLQAIASKCLIVGVMPSDMEEIFGYVPIVEIDMNNAGTQIIDILNNYEKYVPLIEKNYIEVVKNHQWDNRWDIIKKIIEEK